jgi:hypothetical protein
MNSAETLSKMSTKQLLEVAKEVNVVGRHGMRKGDLINAIVSKSTETYTEQTEEVSSTKDLESDLVSSNVAWSSEAELVGNTDHSEDVRDYVLNLSSSVDIVSFPVELPTTRAYKPRTDYIEDAKIGSIVAFRINNKKVLSGAIDEIRANEFKVATKNGISFTVNKRNIVWVKTGKRWPAGVYSALKGTVSTERTE